MPRVLITACTLFCFLWGSHARTEETEPVLKTSLAGGSVTVTVTGQLRDRFEYNQARDFADDTSMEAVSQRTRLGLGAKLEDHLETFIQLQDVRVWGEEGSTLTDYSADGLDLHQGWARVKLLDSLHLKLGRMEMAYDNHRLIGSVPWAQQARTFDAATLQLELPGDHLELRSHLFYAKLGEEDTPAADWATDKDLIGLWINMYFTELMEFSLLFLTDTDYEIDRVRHTAGIYLEGAIEGFHWIGEVYYQFGEHSGQDIGAYLLAVRPGYEFELPGKPAVTAWLEVTSGDDDPTDNSDARFDTLFATNHPKYGFMDFFTNLPVHTGGRGLLDIGLRIQAVPCEGFKLMADYHMFRLMQEDADGNTGLGHELDLTVRYALLKYVAFQLGYSAFLPDDAITSLRGGDATEHWFYLMTDITF